MNYQKNREAGKRGQGEYPTFVKLVKAMPASNRALFRSRLRVRAEKEPPKRYPGLTNHDRMVVRKHVREQKKTQNN